MMIIKEFRFIALLALTTLIGGQLIAAKTPVDKTQKVFDITEYGALADGKTKVTTAIQKAIDACSAAGGGKVVIPQGTFISGTIYLKSNVVLEVVEGAVLKGCSSIKDYPDIIPVTESRYGQYLRKALISAQKQNNIRVFGQGTIDGNRGKEFRGKETKRPPIIWFDECEDVKVEGLLLRRAGMWTNVYSRCKKVHINGITIRDAYGPNNDGCNMADCEDVIIENCDIDSADDAICLKGFTPWGNKNIIIRNNRLETRVNGIKFGTDSSGGFKNVLLKDNVILNSNRAAIAFELVDGGVMENITVDGLKVESASCAFFIKLGNRAREVYVDGEWVKPDVGAIKGIVIKNVIASIGPSPKKLKGSYSNSIPITTASITAYPGQFIENVTLENISIKVRGLRKPVETMPLTVRENIKGYPTCYMMGRLQAYGLFIRHVKNLKMKDVSVETEMNDPRPGFYLDDVHGAELQNLSASSPSKTEKLKHVNSTEVSVTE